MKKITLLVVLAVAAISASAQPFVGLYSFDSVKTTSGTVDPSFVPTATGVTFGSFTAIGTPPNPAAGTIARFNYTGWAMGSMNGDSLYSQMTGIVQDTEYYEVTVAPVSGYTINLDSIKFVFQRSSTGVRTYAVRSSVDGFVSNLTAIYVAPNNVDTVEAGNIFFLRRDNTNIPQNRNQIVLGGAGFSTLSSPVTFRFYGWNSEAAGGTFSIDNVRIIGSAAPAVAIKEIKNSDISVYPNPSANGVFTLDLANVTGKTMVSVYDIIGNSILTKEINSTAKQQIDLSSQANGCYFIHIKNDASSITRKLTITK